MKKKGGHQRRAFSFVEIVVVVIILALGIIPIYDTMIQTGKQTRFNRKRNFAASLACNIVELYKPLNIKALTQCSSDLADYLSVKSGQPDPVIAIWQDEKVQQAMAADEDFRKLVEAYQAEMRKYKIFCEIEPMGDTQAIQDRLAVLKVRVEYKDMEQKKIKVVPSSMIISWPQFPTGRIPE